MSGMQVRALSSLRPLFSSCMGLMAVVVVGVPAAEFYVAPSGDDAQAGSEAAPFATVQRAQEAASPGDTVRIRGGVYAMGEGHIARRQRGRAHVIVLDKSGTEDRPIRYLAVEGEEPVFDFTAVKPEGLRVHAFRVEGSWLHVRGLTVTGVQVTIRRHTQSICFDNEGSHNTFERLTMRDGQAIGFWLGRGAQNLVVNCDAFRNHDHTSEDGRGGNVDGFGFHASKGSVGNVFRGCRAWFNSDDGFDFINTAEAITVENCWAFYNGFDVQFKSLGDGSGFKAGGYARAPTEQLPRPIPRHVVRRCVAVRNKASGFYANHHPGGLDWFHNTGYRNGINFNLLGRNVHDVNDVPGYGHVMRNNLGFRGRREFANANEGACDLASNYFNLPVEITKADFRSLDEGELTRPRQANGDLPRVDFMHLADGSDLIDAGAETKVPFEGKAPDLGAFEAGGKATRAN